MRVILTPRYQFLSSQQPPIILLKEGTDTSQGKAQLISNINACQAITESVRTTLGPRGMDKLVVDSRGKDCRNNILVRGE
jgi:T-complex protein 1 subunit eta